MKLVTQDADRLRPDAVDGEQLTLSPISELREPREAVCRQLSTCDLAHRRGELSLCVFSRQTNASRLSI